VACEESLDGVTREVHRYPIRRVSVTIRPMPKCNTKYLWKSEGREVRAGQHVNQEG